MLHKFSNQILTQLRFYSYYCHWVDFFSYAHIHGKVVEYESGRMSYVYNHGLAPQRTVQHQMLLGAMLELSTISNRYL